jgi:hypothetical protein
MTGATVAALLPITSCSFSHPSYEDLRKIALAVPVPPGLTYLREVDHVNSPAGMFGSDQKEVDLIYSNSAPTCDQLSANWLKTLQKAHRHIDSGAGSGVMYMKKNGVLIAVDTAGIAGTSLCTEPRVAVGKTP